MKREPKLERIDELMPKEIPHHLEFKTDPNFQCSHYILYDTKTTIKEIKNKYLYTVKPIWLFTCIDEFKRKMPGRIIGISRDVHGNKAIRMSL